MSKKLLSLILALALLLSALSCGFVVATAEVTAPEATDGDGYKIQKVADSGTAQDTTYADWLTEITGQANVLSGVTPKLYTNADFTATASLSGTNYLYDGIVPGIHEALNSTQWGLSTNNKVFWADAKTSYLYYDLGGKATIDGLLMASGLGEGVHKLVIYAGDSAENLISDENIIVNETGVSTAYVTLTTPVTVRYLAFHIDNNNYARVSELAAYSDAPIFADGDGYKIQKVADSGTAQDTTYADWLTEITGQANVLSGVTPKLYTNADFTATASLSGTNYLYDGIVPGIHEALNSTQWGLSTNNKVFWADAKTSYLYYDLGSNVAIESLLMASGLGEGVHSLVVYASDSAENLIHENNIIVNETSISTAFVTLTTPKMARYLAFQIYNGNYARVSELGVYAYKPYTVQKFADKATDSADYLKSIMSRTNLLNGASYTLYTAADFSTTASFGNGSSVAALTDGNISGTTDSATSSSKVYWLKAPTSYLVYDLGGIGTIDQLLMASSTTEKNQSIKIYAGNDTATLLNEENVIVNEADLFTGVFTLDEAVAVRYLAFNIVGEGNVARVSELAAYSTSLLAEDKGGYTLETFNNQDYVDYLSSVLAQDNLAKATSPAVYAEDGTKGTLNDDTGSNYKYLTDGSVAGLTDDRNNAYKVHWNSSTSRYMYLDLGKCADVKQLLIAGSYPEFVEYSTKLGQVKIYAGSDKVGLISEGNLIADETIDVGAIITPDKAVSARYVAIWFGASYGRVSELGIYGDYHKIQSLGAGVRGTVSADDTYALRFGFSITATDIGYADPTHENSNYNRAELTATSTAIINDEERKVLDFGAIVSNVADIAAEELTLANGNDETNTGIKTVPADKLYDVADGVVTFTAVVTNVPKDFSDRVLSARLYIVYEGDNGQEIYYHETTRRSVDQALAFANF